MSRSSAVASIRCRGAALGLAALLAAAPVHAQGGIPDPVRAFEARDLAPVEAWLDGLPEPQRDSVEGLRARAWLARRDGDVSGALALIDRAIDAAPEAAPLRLDRAAFRADRIDDAGAFRSLRIARDVRRDLESAVEMSDAQDPARIRALTAMITFHRQAPGIAGGDEDRGKRLMGELSEISPAHYRMQRAMWAAADGDIEAAIEHAGVAMETVGEAPLEWHQRLGRWLAERDRIEPAFAAYLEVLARAPDRGPTLLALGRLSADSGVRPALGIDALRRFLAAPQWPLDPPKREGWAQLAVLYRAVDRAEDARLARDRARVRDQRGRSARD